MADRPKTNMVLPEARANYAFVFKPRPSDEPGKEASYSLMLAFPKATTDESEIAAIKKMMLVAARARWPEQALAWLKSGKIAVPLHDGDESDDPAFHGYWTMTARRKESFGPPGVVDAQVRPFIGEDRETQFYSGCWCFASVTFFAYENSGKKGIGCGLDNVQKIRDGERLSGGKPDPKQDFKPLKPQAGATTASDDLDDDIPF